MRITQLEVKNYRCLNSEVDFFNGYCAISGKNNAGKTNIINILRLLFDEPDEDMSVHYDTDYPVWKIKDSRKTEPIVIRYLLQVSKNNDPGLYDFIEKISENKYSADHIDLSITREYNGRNNSKQIVKVNEDDMNEFARNEIIQKVSSSSLAIYHNSVGANFPQYFMTRRMLFHDLSIAKNDSDMISTQINRKLKKIAKERQSEIAALLMRLEDKYSVGIKLPTLNMNSLPYEISLGEGNGDDVALDDWGSGTRNRTLILLSLLKAKRIVKDDANPSKITPIVIIEEPESFLHPSGQAEFGKLLMSLTKEIGVQVIVTTHSPYMLNNENPKANILLNRRIVRNKKHETEVVDTSAEENWMTPFALTLGLDNSEFEPWKDVMLSKQDKIILVEGRTDKEYLELLLDERHGDLKLNYSGDIFPLCGKDSFKARELLKVLKQKFSKMLILIDLDAEQELQETFKSLSMVKNKDYISIGIDKDGMRRIEGIVPERIRNDVHAENNELLMRLQTRDGRRDDATKMLKKKYLEKFKAECEYTKDYFGEFYKLAKQINKIMK